MQSTLKQHVYVPREQQSSIAPPPDQDLPFHPHLTQADLAQYTTKSSSAAPSPESPPPSNFLSPSASASSLNTLEAAESLLSASSADAQAAAEAAAIQTTTTHQAVSADSPQEAAQDQVKAESIVQYHAEAKVQAQAQAQGTMPRPDWSSIPTDAEPITTLGSIAAAGSQQGTDPQQSAFSALLSQDWQAARVVPQGFVLQPVAGEIGAPLLQKPSELAVFGIDSVLWPNQLMMLRCHSSVVLCKWW